MSEKCVSQLLGYSFVLVAIVCALFLGRFVWRLIDVTGPEKTMIAAGVQIVDFIEEYQQKYGRLPDDIRVEPIPVDHRDGRSFRAVYYQKRSPNVYWLTVETSPWHASATWYSDQRFWGTDWRDGIDVSVSEARSRRFVSNHRIHVESVKPQP